MQDIIRAAIRQLELSDITANAFNIYAMSEGVHTLRDVKAQLAGMYACQLLKLNTDDSYAIVEGTDD